MAQLLLRGFTLLLAVGRLLVQPLGDLGGPPAISDVLHAELPHEGTLAESNLVARLHQFRAFRPIAVHVDLTAVDGLGRQRPRFEKARSPQPLVEANLPWRGLLVVVAHRLLHAVSAVVVLVERDHVVVDIGVVEIIGVVDIIDVVDIIGGGAIGLRRLRFG